MPPSRSRLPAQGAAPQRRLRARWLGAVNSQSTGWAIQGMIAVGADPGARRWPGHSASTTSPPTRPRRSLPLLPVKRPDPCLGDRPGPGRRAGEYFPVAGPAAPAQAIHNRTAPAASRGPSLRHRHDAASPLDSVAPSSTGSCASVPPCRRRGRAGPERALCTRSPGTGARHQPRPNPPAREGGADRLRPRARLGRHRQRPCRQRPRHRIACRSGRRLACRPSRRLLAVACANATA